MNRKGFTIVELMIAISVLSVILLMSTVMITNIGNLYYKGVNQSRIQNDARTISEQVAQNLKLSKGYTPAGPTNSVRPDNPSAFCINTTRYSFVIGKQMGSGDTQRSRHVLWQDTINDPTSCTPIANLNVANPGGTGGSEMITPNARLTKFQINDLGGGLYSVTVGIAYGDKDLLCSTSVPNNCDATAELTEEYSDNGDIRCKGGAASRFCATTDLSTTVLRRVTGN